MSNTKGSMLISNANAVGTELVNKLGGTGYKPSEWADAINLLGISDDDKASALAGITEGTYTGSERGAIKYINCNAVGSMLNKKFSTNRGFKPVEWESAISKLTPLAEGTVSGSICNIVNGADRVPLKNWLVTLPASLSGYTEVNGYKQGANVIDYTSNLTTGTSGGLTFSVTSDGGISYSGTASSTFAYVTAKFDFAIKSGQTFTFSRNTAFSYIHRITLTFSDDTTANVSISANDTSVTYTPAKDVKAVRLLVAGLTTSTSYNDTVYLQTEYGSTATAYEAYEAPTQYTASLGRTIYGGTADIVTGEGEDTCYKPNMASLTMRGNGINREGNLIRVYINEVLYGSNTYEIGLCNLLTFQSSYTAVNNNDHSIAFSSADGNQFLIREDSLSTATKEEVFDFIHGLTVVYPSATSTAFTFTPITPTLETPLGVSNWWSDNGDSTITYRKDPDIPDPPVQLLNMNNNNEDNNEGV